jgi:hypothetical protein
VILSRILAWTALAWTALVLIYYIVWFVEDPSGKPDEILFPTVGVIGLAAAGLGVTGGYGSIDRTWISTAILVVLIFTPGLGGIPFIPAATAMGASGLLHSRWEQRAHR